MNHNNNKENFSENTAPEQLLIEDDLYTISEIQEEIKKLQKEVTNWENGIRDTKDKLILLQRSLREDTIKKQFGKFIAHPPKLIKQLIKQPELIKVAAYLNEGLLRLAIGSYYDDIHKYKEYSGSEWANKHKQAAYTIKWIVNFKPVQIREEYDNEEFLNREIVDINLIFASMCGFSFLDEKVINLISKEKEKVVHSLIV